MHANQLKLGSVAAGLILATLTTSLVAAEPGGKSVKDALPVVVKTVPQAGADDVDPGTKEIRVTYSKEMMDKSWSWGTDADYGAFPEIVGDPKAVISYDKDKRTCVLPVKLEPGKTYALRLNSERFTNFKDTEGKPAMPYLLVFQTKKK